ncbi:MAG: hypothetical protein RL243_94 [Actinomycetota bacterium]
MLPLVHFDARYIRVDHHDGISRFSVGLIHALSRITKVVAVISDERQLAHLPTGIEWVRLNDPTHWSEPFAAYRLNQLGVKVFYSPMQTVGSMGRKFKLVLTLHDLIYYGHPTPPPSMPLGVRIGWRLFHLWYWPQRRLLNAADAVVTVSQTTADLIAKHRLTKRPVAVVYNAAGELSADYEHKPPMHRPRGTQRLIYMGSFMDYKNVQTLVRGMERLPGYELHLLSKITDARRDQFRAMAGTAAGQLVFHNGVSESKYHELLDSAVALVHASHDEGFGIPLVESMARGIPIVVSNIGIFHEIGGEAAEYFQGDNPGDFAAAVKRLETETEWLAKSELGMTQASRFDWEKSASALLAVLQSL